MPRKANLDRYPVLKWFAAFARARPFLWSFKVSSCTPAFYAGSFIAFLPLMGVQIILALGAAIFLRANLPILVGLQAISNPFTIPFLYAFYYMVGKRVMSFLGVGLELNPLLGGFHATFLGGAIVGLLVGAVLDLLYRLTIYETRKLALPTRRGKAPAADQPERAGEVIATPVRSAIPDPEAESTKTVSR